MDIKPLQRHYNGFYLNDAVGNNAFSFDQRQNKMLYVPPLVMGNPQDIKVGARIAFSEIEDGTEQNHVGLDRFLYFPWQGKHIFIFDNHNHAFFFWLASYRQGVLPAGQPLLHIDQHSDMRQPVHAPDFPLQPSPPLKSVFEYTNFALNVGNFIQPALNLGLFSEMVRIDSSPDFEKSYRPPFVLDIDLDIFAPAMDYIPYAIKMTLIKKVMADANFITIATSPYFISQPQCLKLLQALF